MKKTAMIALFALGFVATTGINARDLQARGDDRALLREANKHFEGFQTRVSLPNGERVEATGRARDLIRLELYKQHLARKAAKDEPKFYEEMRARFLNAGPVEVTLTVTDPVSGVETEKSYVESEGISCRLHQGSGGIIKVEDAMKAYPCLRFPSSAEASHSVRIGVDALSGDKLRVAFERYWRELIAKRHLAAR